MTPRRFLGDARGGATALVAAAVAVMTIAGTALVGDHVWLVDQRDVLKNASDSAGIAVTLELNRMLREDPTVSDADLEARLQPLAERYIKLNLRHLPPDRLELAEQMLVVTLAIDRDAGIVGVQSRTDLGGTLMSAQLPIVGTYSGPSEMRVESKAIRMIGAVEVVLALDVSQSMGSRLDGSGCCWGNYADRRISIVKNAASTLVGILNPSADAQVAIGVVPWHRAVRLDADAKDRWARNGWARYPSGASTEFPTTAHRTKPAPHPPRSSRWFHSPLPSRGRDVSTIIASVLPVPVLRFPP